jgi:predicted acyltransferase
LRFAHVLGRIGFAWMYAAVIFMHTKKWSIRFMWCAGLLIVYWLILAFVPAFDNPTAGNFSKEGNFTSYFDRLFLPGPLMKGVRIHDPEGIFATIPATVTALLGMLTGQFVMFRKVGLSDAKRTWLMAVAGLILLSFGLLWSLVFPLNKNLWSSSFVCVTGGLSLLLFALFYFLIDVKGYRKWPFFFTVIGMNSITMYMAQEMINFRFTSNYVFGGLIKLFPEDWAQFLNGITLIAVCWLFLYFLYKQKVFIKV